MVNMHVVIQRSFARLSFSRQFILLSLIVLVIGMLIIGTWMARQIENAVVERAAALTALYVESIVAVRLKDYSGDLQQIDASTKQYLDEIFLDGPLRRKLVRFKLWSNDGEIIYSTERLLVGKKFGVEGALAAAFSGEMQSRVSNLDKPENITERERWDQLIEIYVPIHSGPNQTVTMVAEFYKSVDNLKQDILIAQQRGWMIVAAANTGLFLLLIGLVRRASDTIDGQQQILHQQMDQLRATLKENEYIHEQLGEAGRRTTALNEQFLHRVAADLHDGPAQNIALALLRLDSVAEACAGCVNIQEPGDDTFRTIRAAMQTSMAELRAISAGLSLPGIEPLTLAQTARRAVEDFENKTGRTIRVEIDESLTDASLAVKITLYRLIQESLNNGLKHAQGVEQEVKVRNIDGTAQVEIIDNGPGFNTCPDVCPGGLGLVYMRERVKLVSGYFEINSAPGQGTHILARLPMTTDEVVYA